MRNVTFNFKKKWKKLYFVKRVGHVLLFNDWIWRKCPQSSIKIDTGPVSKVSLIQIHSSCFKTNASLNYAFPFIFNTVLWWDKVGNQHSKIQQKLENTWDCFKHLFLSDYAVFISNVLIVGVWSGYCWSWNSF